MDATGNNDLLKLSGLDDFSIESCQFVNGAEGGSGIDMVGCHNGLIISNQFINMGSNSIQAKGGTQHIRIERNRFEDGGLRNINLGGSTGLQFFRPLDAPFEAADLQVYANIFIGGWAGLAYVGCTRVDVANNTFFMPENWVFRILQETVDPTRFVACGDNLFRNNIIYYGDVNRDVNIGGNTRPESFAIHNNLWYKLSDPNYQGPDLPVTELNGVYQQDPLFADATSLDFNISTDSPAIGQGAEIDDLLFDFNGQQYGSPRSIGAFEGNTTSSFFDLSAVAPWHIYPNPATDYFYLRGDKQLQQYRTFFLLGANGALYIEQQTDNTSPLQYFDCRNKHLPKGIYILAGRASANYVYLGKIIIH
jgi:hypothetical protein